MTKRPIVSDINALIEMCKPIVKYIEESGVPYVEVHISTDEIKVTSTECGIPFKKAINQ